MSKQRLLTETDDLAADVAKVVSNPMLAMAKLPGILQRMFRLLRAIIQQLPDQEVDRG